MSRLSQPTLVQVLALASIVLSLMLPYLSSPLSHGRQAMAEVQGEGLTVWVPAKMLAGEEYRGVVLVADAVDYARNIRLVSISNTAAVVPERVTIEPGMHQAIFDISVRPLSPSSTTTTAARISAVMGGLFGEAGAVISSKDATAAGMIRLLAFNSTNLSYARVVAVAGLPADNDGSYQLPTANSEVTLAYLGGTAKASIESEKGYAVFDVPLVDGPNRISVFGRLGEEITVTRTPVDPAITVEVAALPIVPAWTPEWGYQRSWVMIDASRDGKPIRGDFQLVATSSNPDVLEVEKGITACRLPCAIPVRGYGEGEVQVGVQVTGIGGGSVEIATATPLRYMTTAADVQGLVTKYITRTVGTSAPFVINSTSLSSHSSEKAISSAVTDGQVYGLVGHYATLAANYTTIATAGNMTTLTPEQFSKTVPLVIQGVKYHMSSGGSTQSEWSFFSGLVRGDVGRGSSALTGGMPPSAVVRSTSVGVGSSHAAMSSFDVRLSEPVGPADVKGGLAIITLPDTDIQLAGYLVNGTVRGYAAENKGVSIATFPSLSPMDIVQVPQAQAQAQSGLQMQVEVPPIVYPAEGFVFAAHIVQGGVPLQRVDPLYELGRADPDRAGEVQEIDSVFVHSRSRQVVKATLSAVMNAIELDVAWPEVLKLDRSYDMAVITSVQGARIQVSGDVRGVSSGDTGTVTLYPAGAEGDKRLVVSASKTGWTTTTAEKVVPAIKYVNIKVDAMDQKGNPIAAPFTLEYETVDGDREKIEETSPYTFDVRPFASKPALMFGTAPAEANKDGSSYVHRSTREGDGSFTGIYERQTRFTVINGLGGGYYLAGQSVHVEANPDSQILGFAVVEKFSHWEYDSNSDIYMRDRNSRVQDVIVGESDSVVAAIYTTDFTTLAVLVLSTGASVGAYAYRDEIRTILGAYGRRT